MSNNLLKMTDSLKQDIPAGSNLMFGTVTSIEPLTIFADNRLSLSGDFLVIGQACLPHKVTIPHTHIYNGVTEIASAHTHAISGQRTEYVHPDQEYVVIEIYPKLKVGDTVILFQFGQRFYVAERVEQ